MSTTRKPFELSLEINAKPEDVWRAITDANELIRWFPLESRVTPGQGGKVMLSWGPECQGEAPITVWEPLRHFQTTELTTPPGATAPVPITIDFFIERHGERTRLRLVHAGFTTEPHWDGYYDSIRRGWNFELRGLRHYLEHHAGKPRRVIWVRHKTGHSPEETARRVIGAEGRVLRGGIAGLTEGQPYRLTPFAGPGPVLEGLVRVNMPPRTFAATVRDLNEAYLRFEVEDYGGLEAWLWLSTFGVPAQQCEEIERSWKAALAAALS